MPLTIYQDALNEITASIGEVKLFLKFVVAANQLRPRIGPLIDLGTLSNEQRAVVLLFIQQKDYTVEVGFNGLIVSLAGAFEQFVRRLIRDGVQWINKQVAKYETMKVPLLHQNLLRSGHALATVIDPPAEVIYDYETLCLNLGTCRTDGGQLILNADAFAVHLTNMTQPRIDDALERIGVRISWDVFGNDAGMQQVTGKDGRAATKETKEWLKEFIRKRNRIAHTGIGGIKVTESDVTTAIAFFGAFARVLAAAVEDSVKKCVK
jgi:hypothetical protein